MTLFYFTKINNFDIIKYIVLYLGENKLQFIKDEIRQRMIDAAKEEFLKKGFEKASVRTICLKAKTSKSNLYNYFRNKDHLFYSILEPALTVIQKGIEQAVVEASGDSLSYTEESQSRNIGAVMDFIFEYPAEAKLLLFKSRGSSLEAFKDQIIDKFTDILYGWVKTNTPDKDISRFFIRCVSSFYMSGIEQTILNGAPKEQVGKHINEFVRFVYNGWKGVLY